MWSPHIDIRDANLAAVEYENYNSDGSMVATYTMSIHLRAASQLREVCKNKKVRKSGPGTT